MSAWVLTEYFPFEGEAVLGVFTGNKLRAVRSAYDNRGPWKRLGDGEWGTVSKNPLTQSTYSLTRWKVNDL